MTCPKCGHELITENGQLVCQNCGYGKEAANLAADQEAEPSPINPPQPPATPPEFSPSPQIVLGAQPLAPTPENLNQVPPAPPVMVTPSPTLVQSPPVNPVPTPCSNPTPASPVVPPVAVLSQNDPGVKAGLASTPAPFMPTGAAQADREAKPNTNLMLLIVMAVIVILIVATLIIGFIAYSSLTKATMIGDQPSGQFTQGEVVNCDEIGPNSQISDPTGKNQACLKENFLKCQPAKVNYASYGPEATTSTSKPTPETLVEYQIMGLDNNLCSVKVTYLTTPTPLANLKQFDYKGQSLTCGLENSQDGVFQEFFGFTKGQPFTTVEASSTQPELKCSGEAYNLQQLMKKTLNK